MIISIYFIFHIFYKSEACMFKILFDLFLYLQYIVLFTHSFLAPIMIFKMGILLYNRSVVLKILKLLIKK